MTKTISIPPEIELEVDIDYIGIHRDRPSPFYCGPTAGVEAVLYNGAAITLRPEDMRQLEADVQKYVSKGAFND